MQTEFSLSNGRKLIYSKKASKKKEGQYWTYCTWKIPIAECLQTEKGRTAVLHKVFEVLSKLNPGEEIYNPNLREVVALYRKPA
jgi:hypothetical protein